MKKFTFILFLFLTSHSYSLDLPEECYVSFYWTQKRWELNKNFEINTEDGVVARVHRRGDLEYRLCDKEGEYLGKASLITEKKFIFFDENDDLLGTMTLKDNSFILTDSTGEDIAVIHCTNSWTQRIHEIYNAQEELIATLSTYHFRLRNKDCMRLVVKDPSFFSLISPEIHLLLPVLFEDTPDGWG